MSYNPSDDLTEYLEDSPITSYRLTDGTYLLAEEVDYDEECNILSVTVPVQLKHHDNGKFTLEAWIECDIDDCVQLVGDKIICRVNTPMYLKMHYYQYCIIQQLRNTLSDDEIDEAIDQITNPLVDNLDYLDYFNRPSTDYSKEWRSKWKNN